MLEGMQGHTDGPPEPAERLTVTSGDGTTISCWRSGSGPALVIVHGTTGSHAEWEPLTSFLKPHLTTYVPDRRGRGASGDGANYALDREVEDVLAIVRTAETPTHLLGHSFGGVVALEAAREADALASLVLYEPINALDRPPEESIARLDAMLDAGDEEGALATFLTEHAGMSHHELELARSSRLWAARVGAASTIPRELRAHRAYEPDWAAFTQLSVPTLLLTGTRSERYAQAARTVADTIPGATVRILDGQGHAAHLTAPKRLADALLAFLHA